MFMKRVFICSPYRGDVERNLKAARKHARMAAIVGYCPMAPHLMFPQFLNDNDPEQRILGITLGVEQMKVCDEIWIFGGRISNGMAFELEKAKELGIDMLVYTNPEGKAQDINPFDHGSAYTDIMKTQALKQALKKYGFTAAFGGGRRDEEKSRAKERIFSFRNEAQAWDPKNQRPEMWKLYNTKIHKGESIRVFPLSNCCRWHSSLVPKI